MKLKVVTITAKPKANAPLAVHWAKLSVDDSPAVVTVETTSHEHLQALVAHLTGGNRAKA